MIPAHGMKQRNGSESATFGQRGHRGVGGEEGEGDRKEGDICQQSYTGASGKA